MGRSVAAAAPAVKGRGLALGVTPVRSSGPAPARFGSADARIRCFPGSQREYDLAVAYAPAVAQVEHVELARLLDTAERPRTRDWSLRAALTRYGQPQPLRASAVIELLRRIEAALRAHGKLFERDGDAVWQAIEGEPGDIDPGVVGLLRALSELDRLGDALALWAVDRQGERPDAAVDAVVTDVGRRLEVLGAPHEERPRPGRGRG